MLPVFSFSYPTYCPMQIQITATYFKDIVTSFSIDVIHLLAI